MKNRSLSFMVSGLVIAAGLSLVAVAQNTTSSSSIPTARKLTDVTWHEIRLTKFKPGKMNEAMKIVEQYYDAATEKAGLPHPVRYLHVGSDWHVTTIFTMTGGVEDLNWDVHPNNEKWLNAMAQICGGADKAKAIREQYMACVADRQSSIAYQPDLTKTKTAAASN